MINPHDLNSLVSKPEDKIPSWAWPQYYFLKQGISYNEFKELPLPYIFTMLKIHKIQQDKKDREK